jgi:hypothetical protein
MDWKRALRQASTPNPRGIEVTALVTALGVVSMAAMTLVRLPSSELTRENIIAVLDVMLGGLGVASLLLVWAQLRHTSTQSKLIAYHEHFQELPKESKVSAMYTTMARLKIEQPLWQTPLSVASRDAILNDDAPARDTAQIVVREYLNDFEEFAAAVNSGLVDDDYAYHLEGSRTLNAYFGFEEIIGFWLRNDQERAQRQRADGITPNDYYGELKTLAMRWKVRKFDEAAELERRSRRGISERL